jgi:hypothetical protein
MNYSGFIKRRRVVKSVCIKNVMASDHYTRAVLPQRQAVMVEFNVSISPTLGGTDPLIRVSVKPIFDTNHLLP